MTSIDILFATITVALTFMTLVIVGGYLMFIRRETWEERQAFKEMKKEKRKRNK